MMPRSLVRALSATTFRNQVPIGFTGRSRVSMPFIRYNDLEAQLQAMGSVGILFAIVDKLATAVASVEWHLYRKAKSGKPEDRIEVTDHPALTVLRKPNAFTTQQEMVEAGQQHHELTGETWLVVGRSPIAKTLPLELWNVRPDRMKPVPDNKNFLVGYIYTSPDGEEVPLQLQDVIFIRRPNPMDPFRGISSIGSVLAHIDGERYSAEWNRNFFINGAHPGGIIQVDKRLSDPEFDEMVLRWREQHQGIANAHRVAVLENGAKYIDARLTQKDMDFTGLSNLSGEKIRESFGFPKPMLGSVDDVNRANAEAGEYVFARWLVDTRVARWKQALNNDFLPLFGEIGTDLEFDYDSPVPADRAADNQERDSKVTAAVAMIGLGFDPEEVCEWLDLPVMTYTKPKPPPAPSPPPGAGGTDDPGGSPPGTGEPGAPGEPAGPAGPAEENALRLVRLLADAPEVVGLVRAAFARESHDGHGGHRHGHDDRDDGEPWRAAAADRPDGPPAPDPPTPPDGVRPELAAEALPDLGPVQTSWLAAVDDLLAAYTEISDKQKESILNAVANRVSNGDVLGLTSIGTPNVTDASALIEGAMMDLGMSAGEQVVTESKRQGVEDMHPMGADRMRTAATAQTLATMLARDLVASAVVETLRVWRQGAHPDEVRAQVKGHLDTLTDARPRMLLSGALTQAQHDGRCRTIGGGPEAALYADEVLDTNTCPPCRSINRKWIGNSGDAMTLETYPRQGYAGCRGRQRCRGQVVAVWRSGRDWKRWVELPDQRTD
jgi:HK97 family phage portal protein